MCQGGLAPAAVEAGLPQERGLGFSKGAGQAGSGGQWDRSLTAGSQKTRQNKMGKEDRPHRGLASAGRQTVR